MPTAPTALEHLVKPIDIIVSKGDREGNIIYANPIFFKLSGYTKAELIDQPHSIIRHPDMPKIIFKFLWNSLDEGKEIHAFVKNLSKDGGFYWVFAHIHTAYNPDGSFRNFISTRRAISPMARQKVAPLYKAMVEAEKEGGIVASLPLLKAFLADHGGSLKSFNEVMQKLQEG
jgi:PAS domain S-box-containing protein